MADNSLRVALDANILVAGVWFPRWPYEVMLAATRGAFDLVLSAQVIREARRHLKHPDDAAALESFLMRSAYREAAMPSRRRVRANLDLVRSEKDVPIAMSLMDVGVDIFVTNDRDFTDPDATADRFRRAVRVMLAAVFLRDVLGWSPDALEAIRNRTWNDLAADDN